MKGDASVEQIATLEDIFELSCNTEAIEQIREDVETNEEAVRKQAALAEQARLKEQAAREQESKAKSIKAKYISFKRNEEADPKGLPFIGGEMISPPILLIYIALGCCVVKRLFVQKWFKR